MRRRFFILVSLLIIAIGTAFAARNWEEVSNPPAALHQQDKIVLDQEDTDILIHEGAVYISSSKPVQVKVFTILGQIISSETVPAGCHRLKLNSRGIYILRIGTQTRRITI